MTETVYSILAVAPTVATALGLPIPRAAQHAPLQEVLADLQGVPRLAVLAPDAVGLSVWQHWREQMPFLTSLHAQRHLALRSVPPPVTPVNFAALVTGAPMEVHKVGDRFGKLGCESLFDVVRAAGGLSLGAGQPGFTGGEFLARHADLNGRPGRSGDEAVELLLLRLVRAHQPQYVIAQLGDVDARFHQIGPSAAEAEPVIRATDARLARITAELLALDYGVIILADHGQHDVPIPGEPTRFHGGHDGSAGDIDFLVPCTWTR